MIQTATYFYPLPSPPPAIRAFGSAGLPLSPSSIELKRFGADAAHDDTQFIALAAASGPGAGLVLWSAGVHSLCLWDAEDGTYLGHIHEKGSGERGKVDVHRMSHFAYSEEVMSTARVLAILHSPNFEC